MSLDLDAARARLAESGPDPLLEELISAAEEGELLRASLTIPEVYAGIVTASFMEELESAQAQLREARLLLRSLEFCSVDWSADPPLIGCQMCSGDPETGHRPDCALGKWLGTIEPS
jgi:hypothetical protein